MRFKEIAGAGAIYGLVGYALAFTLAAAHSESIHGDARLAYCDRWREKLKSDLIVNPHKAIEAQKAAGAKIQYDDRASLQTATNSVHDSLKNFLQASRRSTIAVRFSAENKAPVTPMLRVLSWNGHILSKCEYLQDFSLEDLIP